jgi:hypothetical protein
MTMKLDKIDLRLQAGSFEAKANPRPKGGGGDGEPGSTQGGSGKP